MTGIIARCGRGSSEASSWGTPAARWFVTGSSKLLYVNARVYSLRALSARVRVRDTAIVVSGVSTDSIYNPDGACMLMNAAPCFAAAAGHRFAARRGTAGAGSARRRRRATAKGACSANAHAKQDHGGLLYSV